MRRRLRTSLLVVAWLFAVSGCSKENDISQPTTVCDDNTLDCVPCEAGEYRCDDATLKVCQADGQGFDAVSVCVSEALCVKGLPNQACAAPGCNPADTRCVGSKMWVCPPGQDALIGTDCPSVESCTAGLASGKCAAGECSGPSDCTGVDTECRKRTCEAGSCSFSNEPADTPCETNRVCDGFGNCVGQCNLPTDCSGVDTECRTRKCELGWCGFSFSPAGTLLNAQVDGDCLKKVCDGAGDVSEEADSTDLPDDSNPCTADTCVGTTPTHGWEPAGTPCSGTGTCDGAGACSTCLQGERQCKTATTAQVCDGTWQDEACGGLTPRCDHGQCVGGSTLVWVPEPGGGTYGIDSTEVTRAQYEDWLSTNPSTVGQPAYCSWNATHTLDSNCMSASWVCQGAGCATRPQECADWCDAYAYCRAMGKRLCGKIGGGPNGYTAYSTASHSQWYNACSSGGQFNYPYGGDPNGSTQTDGYNPNSCHVKEHFASDTTLPVAEANACQSSLAEYSGVFDMSGNLKEWEDSCDDTSGQNDACRVRGGAFPSQSNACMCESVSATSWQRRTANSTVGFRCCSDP